MMKTSIKREQSQAGLSFAERENRRSLAGGESKFRPQVKNKLLLLLALLMTAATGAWGQEVIPETLDFTSNSWGIPSGSEEKTADENSYTSGGYTITLCGSSGNGYYFSPTEPYILLGKQGAYLQLPAFSSAVDSIKVVGSPNASTAVEQNIYVGDVAVSTATTGMKNVTQKYVIAENYRTAGTIYRIKVTSAHNTQIKKVLVYFTPAAGYTVSLKDGVKDADKWTVKVGEGQAQALPIGGLKGDGSETVTLQYNGRLKVKGVKATSDAGAPATPASLIANPVVGQIIGSDGKNYDANATLPTGVTKVAKICYVGSETGEAAPYNHGLALALSDANDGDPCTWKTSNTDAGHTKQASYIFTEESGLQYNDTHNSDTYPAFKAAIANNDTAAPTGCSSWFLPSGYQWKKMIGAAGLDNLGLTWGGYYWSSSEYDADNAWDFDSYEGIWYNSNKYSNDQVRACLAF